MADRSKRWHRIWQDRELERADWNGFEELFSSMDEYEAFTKHVAETLRNRLDLNSNDIVLDLGCGSGRVAEEVARHVKAVVAVDYSETVVQIARARASDNITYHVRDLNAFSPTEFEATKAYCVSTFLYLNSESIAFNLISGFQSVGVPFAVMDIPDAQIPDRRPRHYDRDEFTHLRLDPDELLRRFPQAEIVRGEFPEYLNNASRFDFYATAPL